MRIETVNNRQLVCEHIFPHNELKVGQLWSPADGSNKVHKIVDISEDYVFHIDIETNIQYRKDAFGFQCRYCMIME